jgi:predicted aldo/keto reductase-like oxidoreductase
MVMTAPMPTRPLGRTGWQASVLTLGGVKWDTQLPAGDAVALIQRALELGVNTFDTAHGYGDGESERRLGRPLRGIRLTEYVQPAESSPTPKPAFIGLDRHQSGDRIYR